MLLLLFCEGVARTEMTGDIKRVTIFSMNWPVCQQGRCYRTLHYLWSKNGFQFPFHINCLVENFLNL